MMDQFEIIAMFCKVLPVVFMLVNIVPIMVWVERRGSGVLQNRSGPNRIGPLGLLQSLVDAIKMMMKEDYVPGHVTKFYYLLAPVVTMIPAFMTFAVIPFGSQIEVMGRVVNLQISEMNVGVLYILSITSLGVYGIIMAGWASNNKYSLLGSLRSSAQMISYELSMGLALVGILMTYSSVHLGDIARLQGEVLMQLGPLSIPKWGIFMQPVAFFIFTTAVFAETNRLPFDLPEGESEIVAGYHLEFNSMKFGMFMMAEYVNMAVGAALISTLFFGGWQFLPGMSFLHELIVTQAGLSTMWSEILRVALEVTSFLIKTGFFLWVFVWVRWTIPRFRYDQLMDLGWKVMLPLSLVNIFATGYLIFAKVI